MNWTVELISDSCAVLRGEFVLSSHFFLYVQSGLKDFTFMCPNEVRPSPDVAVFVKALAVLSLGLLCVYCTVFQKRRRTWSDGGNRGGRGMFVLFLVQYAVHKSLALEILQFLLISSVVKWVHCCFFFIKTLWTIENGFCFISFT